MTDGNGCGLFALAASDAAAAPADATRTTTSDAIRTMDGPPNHLDLSGEGTDYPTRRILTRQRLDVKVRRCCGRAGPSRKLTTATCLCSLRCVSAVCGATIRACGA